jgi:hypothetical protein
MNNRILGMIAMICAPALLIETLWLQGRENPLVIGIASSIFMAGWICSNIGMQRMQATGTGAGGRAVLIIQLVGLVLACAFGLIEATGLFDENNIVSIVTDAAWPLSMLFMLVVGSAVLLAKRLSGWQRFVPLMCGLAFPVSIILSLVTGLGLDGPMEFVFFGLTAILWMLLGYVVRSEDDVLVISVPVGSAL